MTRDFIHYLVCCRHLMEVWLASMRPDTLWEVCTYGDFLDRATWMEAGPQGMKLANFLSLILWRDLCT